MKAQFIAHLRKKDGELQIICSQLMRTSALAGQFSAQIGLKGTDRLIGLLHDIGKISSDFWRKLTGYSLP